MEKNKKILKLFGDASILLGASRFSTLKESSVNDSMPVALRDIAISQFSNMLLVNATQAAILDAHILLDAIEFQGKMDNEVIEKKDLRSKAFRFNVEKGGKGMIDLGASMLVSRLSSSGALMEAQALGYQQYRVAEVIDKRTCPVCQTMDGKTFPVSAGLDALGVIMASDSADHLRQVAPWPKQDKESVAALGRMSNLELSEGGLSLPPYHPLCRGIVVVEEKTVDLGTLATLQPPPVIPAAPTSGASVGASAAILSDRLFGSTKDLQAEASSFFGVGGTSAFFTTLDEEIDLAL